MQEVRRGEIFYADIPHTDDSVQSGRRPVIVVQNDKGNIYSPNVIVLPLTSQLKKLNMPTHTVFNCNGTWSVIQGETPLTISKGMLQDKICSASDETMRNVDAAIMVSFGLDKKYRSVDNYCMAS